MKNASAPFNPGERLTVPFASYPLRSCGGMDSLDLQKPGNAVRMLKEMGVGQTFLAVEAPWGDPVAAAKEKAILCRHIETFHHAGIRAGVWFWPGVYPTGERELIRQVLADGSVLAKCCPLDEDYLSALETYTASLAETGADALMIDDGFRYGFENRNFGCFCPLHLRAVSERVGHEVSAADLRRATLSGGENTIRSAFLKVNAESLVGFARRMRAAVDRVNPSVRIAVCSAPSSWETDGTDPETVSRAFAGNTKPFLRTSGAPYWADHRSFGCRMEDIIEFERFQTAAFAKPDMEVMWEGDAYPRPRWNCAASYMECFDLARAIADPAVHNLKYLFEYSTEPENEQGYFKRHMRNLPLYRAISEHFDDKCPCGIRVFEVPHKYDRMDIPERFENKSYDLQLTCFNPSSKILSPAGLPTVFAGDGTGIAVFGENAKYLPETDFGKGLLLDARAAEILSARGLDVGLRGEGKGFAADMEHYLADGFHIRAFDQPIRNFTTDASAIPETTALSPDGVTVATSYRYENAAGQRFFVLCSEAYGSVERYHRVYGRSHLLARAAEWVSGRKLPAWTSGSPDLYLMCKENDGALAVGLFNLFEDEALDTEIHLGDSYRSVTFFSGSGRLDGDRVLLDDIPPFGVVTFEVTR